MPDVIERELEIKFIQIDAEIQPREGLDDSTVAVLKELYEEDQLKAFPHVVVYHDADDVYWLADGHYRIKAISEASVPDGSRTVRAEVREGSKREAILYAAGANAKHGTPLTNAEKRRVVERLLHDDEWGQWSSREIARHIGTSNGFVSSIRRELEAQSTSVHETQIPPKQKIKAKRGGKEYSMEKGNIGRGTRAKAKTATPTPMPDSASDPEEVRGSDEEWEAAPPKGFIDLIAAWFRASSEDRQTFLAWAEYRNTDEPTGETTPEEHARLHLIAREPIQDVAEAYGAMR